MARLTHHPKEVSFWALWAPFYLVSTSLFIIKYCHTSDAVSTIASISKSISSIPTGLQQQRRTQSATGETIETKETGVELFNDCDMDNYYSNQDTNPWNWKREDITLLLMATHRNVLKFSVDTFEQEETVTSTPTVEQALVDLDAGTRSDGSRVRMILTQSEMLASPQVGWLAGHLWPLIAWRDGSSTTLSDDLTFFSDGRDKSDEWATAFVDLHNLRPAHPSIYAEQVRKGLYYAVCDECISSGLGEGESWQDDGDSSGGSSPERERIHDFESDAMSSDSRPRSETNGDEDNSNDSLCLCKDDNAIQPPPLARGEIARSLLYMELRYGTKTAASDGLGLILTDCFYHTDFEESPTGGNTNATRTKLGYLSELVQWHLEYPPTDAEKDRNDKVCRRYQGNRNPFVDFPQDSWSLLNFLEETCLPVTQDDDPSTGNGSGIGDADEDASENDGQEEVSVVVKSACEDLLPGDLNFYLVESGFSSTSGAKRDAFGIVTLVDLPEGLELFVTDNAWMGQEKGFQTTEGTLKLQIPIGGIGNGMYFGYGGQLNLGTSWEHVEEDGDFAFSLHDSGGLGDQLFLYCTSVNSIDTDALSYNIIAALSTTGTSFESDGMDVYSNEQSALPSNLDEHGYGVIILPSDAADEGTGYRYSGPIFTKQDQYAKALINQEYWQRTGGTDLIQSSQESKPNEIPIGGEDKTALVNSSGSQIGFMLLPLFLCFLCCSFW